jgi:hypothetical protein
MNLHFYNIVCHNTTHHDSCHAYIWRAPKLLDRFKCESEMKLAEE